MFTYKELGQLFDKNEIETIVITDKANFKDRMEDAQNITELQDDKKYAIVILPLEDNNDTNS